MNPREFFIKPADYGLPSRDELVAYRIWDNHFHGFAPKNPIEQYEQNSFFVERMGIERSIAQEVGGTLEEPFAPYQYDAEILKILERDKDRLSGRTPIDPGFPEESCAKIEKWIRNGPCIGIKYPGTGKTAVTCSHPITIRSCGSPRNWTCMSISIPGSKWAARPACLAATICPRNRRRWIWPTGATLSASVVICGHSGATGSWVSAPSGLTKMSFWNSRIGSAFGMVEYAIQNWAWTAWSGADTAQPQLRHGVGQGPGADISKGRSDENLRWQSPENLRIHLPQERNED
jgi:hypothetical protein